MIDYAVFPLMSILICVFYDRIDRIQAQHDAANSVILIALAEGHIIARAELEVMVDNQAAIALYRKMGFSEVGVYKNYWFVNNGYKDAVVMQKSLDD